MLSRPVGRARIRLIFGALFVGALLASPAHMTTARASSSPWLDRFNAWRANAGVAQVTENTTYDAGDVDHAIYMVKNDLVTHYETPGTPYYTTAGDTAARNSNIFVSSSTATTDIQAIDWWMGAPFHAMGMMDPRLTTTGFGSYREVKTGWDMGAAVNVGQGNSFTGGHFPVFFPGDGTSEPLTAYSGNEFPDPLQACSGYAMPTGLPVFVELGGNISTSVTASSFTGNGVALPHCVIDSSNATLAPYLSSRGGAILIPRAPLVSGERYTVSMTVNGTPYTWSFTVGNLSAAAWTASYDMTTVPTSWGQGATRTFEVKVTNTGTVTWPSTGSNAVMLDANFSTTSGGANGCCWLTSQAFTLPADVAPGGSATVTVTATAPNTSGSLFLEVQLLKNQEFWFGTWGFTPVSIAALWSAAYDVSAAPATWIVGQTQTFSVTLTNTGTMPWLHGGTNPIELDIHFSTTPGGSTVCCWLTSQVYALPADVAPNASVTLTVGVSAPSSAGALYLEAETFKNQQFWFTQAKAVPVNVYHHWQGSVDMSGAPTTWVAGQTRSFPVTVHNLGDQAWPSGTANPVKLDLNFSTGSGGANGCCWLTSQTYSLPANVAPGGSATLTVSVTAPGQTGRLFLEAQLFKNQQFWFPTWNFVTVSAGGTYTATYDLSHAPRTWTAGQSQTFQVTVTNTGNVTWQSTGYYEFDLDLHFTTAKGGSGHEASWLTSLAYSLPNDLAPGASATFSITVTAPSTTGSMQLEAEMIKEHAFWFVSVAYVAVAVA